MKMRIPTNKEWDEFMDTVQKDNNIAHWKNIFPWVHDLYLEKEFPANCALRGGITACFWSWESSGTRFADLGFRPALDVLETDALASGGQSGGTVIIGTLYMGGKPVKIPQNPTDEGDIVDYIQGTKLEMREALEDPAYQVTAIKVGKVLIADRCLLRNISSTDIRAACRKGRI